MYNPWGVLGVSTYSRRLVLGRECATNGKRGLDVGSQWEYSYQAVSAWSPSWCSRVQELTGTSRDRDYDVGRAEPWRHQIVISIVWDTAVCTTALQYFIFARKVYYCALVILYSVSANIDVMMSPDVSNSTVDLAGYKMFLIYLQVLETCVVHVTRKSRTRTMKPSVCVGDPDIAECVMSVTSQTTNWIEYFSSYAFAKFKPSRPFLRLKYQFKLSRPWSS